MYYVAAPRDQNQPLYGPVRQHSNAADWARRDAIKHREDRHVHRASDGALSAAYNAQGVRVC